MVFSKPFSISAIMAGICTMSRAQQTIFLPEIQPEYDVWGHMDNKLLEFMPLAGVSVNQWEPGWVPESCFDHSWLNGIEPEDIDVFDVTFSDCPEPFVVCRHRDTQASFGLIITSLARLPARMRQWAGNFVAIPTIRPDAGGWQSGQTIVIQDNNWFWPGLMVHEMIHAIDLIKLGNYFSGGWDYYSNTPAWTNQVSNDGVLASNYSGRNYIEAFAEVGRIYAYEAFVPGGLASLPPPVSQIQNQVDWLGNLLSAEYTPGQCNGKVGSSVPRPVPVAKLRGSSRKPGPMPNVTVTAVPEIPVPKDVYKMEPVCELSHEH